MWVSRRTDYATRAILALSLEGGGPLKLSARNQLAGLMGTASRDREPITITRNGTGKVGLLAIEEYEAMETTLHLYSTRANATQIQQSLADYTTGKTQAGELCD